MRHYSEALYEALRPDPFYLTLENAYTGRYKAREAMLRYYDLSIREGKTWGRLGTADGVEGISVWSVPLSDSDARKKSASKVSALSSAMGTACAKLFQRIETSMARSEARLDLESMWYLSILGVSPAQQGQGFGPKLLAPVLAEADAAGVASYLTTFTPRNIPFYERQGYVDAGCFSEPVTGAEFTVLVRQPPS